MEDLFPPDYWATVRMMQNEGQRYGQAVFNAAAIFYPENLYQLDGSLYDPFYIDSKVPAFLERLADRLTR